MFRQLSSLCRYAFLLVGLLIFIQPAVGQSTAPQISTPADLGSVATNSAIEPIVLQAVGGTQPYTWSLVTGGTAGVIPPGLALGADGRITGIPTTAQPARTFTVRVTDAANATVQKAFTIAVGTDSPRISSAAMGAARVGEAYSHTFQVLQGKRPYTWSTNSTLPVGLTLNPTTGVISGTPDSSSVNATASFRDYPIALRLTTSGNATNTANFTLTVAKPMEWVTPPNLPVQFAGPNCTVGISVSGGKAPYNFALQSGSALPPGLSLGNSTGILSGRPSAVGNYTFTINATDSVGSRISRAFSIQFIPYTLAISGPASASGTQYSSATPLQFSAIGGAEPYRYSATNLPAGLTLNATTGLIRGNFNGTAGTTNFAITVTDNKAMTANATCAYTITPGPALKWTIDPALPSGKVLQAYSANLSAASGGWGPYTYSVNASTLPAGLTFNSATRRLSGNVTAGGNFSVVLTVRDSATPPNVVNATLSNSAMPSIPLYIEPYSMSINGTKSLTVAQYAALPATSFSVVGGAAPYKWSTAAIPPATLKLTTTGVNGTAATLSGNATAAPGNYTIGVKVTDKTGQSVTSNVTLTITPLQITWGTQPLLPSGKVGSSYTTNLTVSGGRPTYTYALKNGSVLPAGLTLNATTGVISGTPTKEIAGGALAGKVILNVSKTGNDTTGNGSSAAPFATIQKAIDSASNGNVVLVGPGTYSGAGNANLNLRGKQIVVKSSAGADQTILDLGRQKGISADSTETLDTVIDGFTFKNGYVQSGADWGGEAIVCTRNQASLKIKNCVFTLNEAKATYVTTSMQIVANRSSSASIPQVENCLFYENTIGGGGWTPYSGGGASVISGFDVLNSTIANNTLYSSVSSWSGFAGGIRIAVAGDKIKNTIVWGNSASFYPSTFPAKYQAGAQSDSSTSVAYSISQNGTINNGSATVLNSDPKFINATSGDFRLAAGSPAIDAGDPASTKDPDGSRADMGYRKTADPSSGFAFITILASDSAAPVKNTAEREFTLPIASYGMAVSGPDAASGAQYSSLNATQFMVSGGVAPYRWSATGLPATLSINATTGLVSGNLTAAPGNYTANITVTDNRSQTATKNFTITVSALPMAWSTNATLPAGKVADAYSTNLTVTSGRPPYTYALSNSTLPAGLALNTATGLLSGTPTAAGNYSFTINTSDSAVPKNTISRNFTFTVAPYGMELSGPVSIIGKQYSTIMPVQVIPTGGLAPLQFSATGLPASLSLNATAGTISGTLTAAPGNYTSTITLRDARSQTVTRNLTVTILPPHPVTWLPETLPPMRVGIPFSANLTASGGRSPYTFLANAGALPTGLTLSTAGVLSGTPTRDGNFTFTISAADSGTPKNTANRTFSVPVLPYGMSIAENPVISGKRFTSITPVQLAVTGGTANYTWSASPSPIVPASLTLNSSTGILSGNLTAAPGNYTFVASVRDGRNQTATRNLTVSILQVDPINWTTNATLTPGKVADNYSANLTVRDGTPPYTFAIKSGSTLPGNLTLNASTSTLRGIPATAGNFTFTLVAKDSGNATTERAFTLAVAPYGMAITNEPPITGQVNQSFSYPFTVTGGIAAYTWNATGAPAGLSINATTGVLSGTPTSTGNFATSVRVTDGKTQTVSRNYTISIAATAPLSISTPPNLGTIDIAKGYTTTLQAVGGKPPYTWTINGTKPASVNLAANGTLTANSSTALTANFTVRVQDSSVPVANATQSMTLVFRNPNQLAIATNSLPQGRASSEYSHQLAATGGTAPYQWTIASGTLPAGMVFSPTGWLTGTPNTTANATLTFEVTDSIAAKATRQFQLLIGGSAGNTTASGKLFTDVTSTVSLPEHYIIGVEDFDNDGREDLLATNSADSIALLRNGGAFDFRDITANSGLTDARPALVADFNNDGVSDILSVNLQRTEAALFLNNGQGVFTKQPLPGLLMGDLANYRDISYADVDGDGDLDLLFNINAATGGGVVAVFNQANLSQSTAPLFSGKSYLVKTTWKNAKFSVTDANGDSKPDLIVIQTNGVWPTDTHRSNPATLYLNTGNSTVDYTNPTGAKNLAGFTIKSNSGIVGANEMSAFASLDIDNDGDLDLLNGSSDWPSASVPRIFINNGNSTYTQKDSPIIHGSYYHHGATIFDADLDGDQDAVWTSLHVFKDVYPRMWENGATYLKATANGTVDPAKAFYDATVDWGVDAKISGSGNMGSAGYVADLDGDGDLDFVTNLWSNTTTFKVYRNDANLRQANWLKVELIGAVSPAQGTGARVEVELKDATAKKPSQVTGASRYEVVTGNFTWTQAKADAESKGGHLATITSADEWQIIQQSLGSSLSGKNLWLGATDVDQEGVWKWITGEPWGYARWFTSQPDNHPSPSGPEDFLHITGYEDSLLRWNDTLPKSFTGVGCSYLLEYDQPNSTTATTKLAQYFGSDIGSVTNSSLTFGLADKTQAAKVTVYWPSGLKSVLENVDGNRVIQIREADELPLPRPTEEGDVIAWGANPNGETTVPTNLGKAVQIAAGDSSSAALLANGTVSVWGTNWAAQRNVPATLNNVVQIAAGNNHYLALTANGSLAAWGWNTTNQTIVPTSIKRAKFIAAGFNSSYAITGDGRIVAWGANDVGQLNVPAGLSGVTTLSAGRGHVLALKSNGTVVAWGRNDLGQATVPAGLSNVIQIATGDYHSLALKSDGTVVAWGANWITQSTVPAGLGNVVQISAKADRSLALKADNSVVSWGLNADNIAPPPAPGTMLGISAGSKHSLGLVRKIQIALTGDLPVLKENQPLSDFGFTATGGSGNYTWSVVGTKPDWLTLNATTGLLSGTPSTAGNQTVTIRVSSGGRWSDRTLTFEIQKAIPTAIWVATTGNNTTGDGSLSKPFATITKAHSVAIRGDVIKVLPGNYTESVVIEKAVEISSTAGPVKTTIRSAGLASAVYCKGEGVKGGKLIGFTLTGGGGANNSGSNRYGGGFAINAPAGTTYEVKNCIIADNNNAGITFGGGLHATGGTTLSLTNSLVHSNAAWANGGAAYIEGANLIADRCTIVSNTNNGFNRIGGISAAGNCNIQIKNSILWSNTTNLYGSFSSGPAGNATFTFSYSNIQGLTTAPVVGNTKTIVVIGPGCIDADPKFAENYTLRPDSPCINTGDPTAAKDADGTRADMGWDFASAILGSDTDGDGLSDEWEMGSGRYQFIEGNFTWEQAKADAEARGGHLATITSSAENDYVASITNKLAWIGGSDKDSEGNWKWVTGEPFVYQSWWKVNGVGEPDNFTGNQHYLITNFTAPKYWGDNYGSDSTVKGYVLEFGYPTNPTNPDSDGDGVTDSREENDGTNPNDPTSFDPLSRGLVAYYPFNGNAKDESGNGNHGVIYGASFSVDRNGQLSSAMDFNGAGDYVSAPSIAATGNSQRTLVAWVKSNFQDAQCFISTGQPSNAASFNLVQYSSSPGVMGYFYDFYPTSGRRVADDSWHMVVATFNGTALSIYIDGVLENKDLKSSYQTSGQQNFLGKSSHSGYEAYFKGSMDDIRIYNRALSAAEVTQLYSKESGQPNTVLVQGGTLPAGSALAGQAVSPFHIARFETTWAEWKTVRTWAAANGYDIGTVGQGSADNHPVQNVSWHDALKWCNAKSQMEGLAPVYQLSGATYKNGQSVPTVNASANGYRLPSENEWEWAARGGVLSQGYTYSGSNDLNAVAWHSGNAGGGTKAIGSKAPNELGIYDMSGNVWEWCFGDCRFRGGGWADGVADYFSLQRRNWGWPGSLPSSLGFRIARNAIGEMVTVQGGTLPAGSGLAGQSVQAFQIGRTEVTWGEWKSVRDWAVLNGYSDLIYSGSGGGAMNPVQNINWQTIVKWCNAKSEKEGLSPVYYVNGAVCRSGTPQISVSNVLQISESADGYRIPSMKEWFWAHEGGLLSQNYTFSGSNSLDSVAWTGSNSYNSQSSYLDGNGRGTWPAGLKQPNELGIYDMTGNVSEWSWNAAGPYFCLGGGCYWDQQNFSVYSAPTSNSGAGLRLARNIGPKFSISGTMPEPTLNKAYAGYTFTASGTTGAPVWSVSSGSLPLGMSFNATTATLSGTPTTAGNYTFTIKVASGGYSDEVEVLLPVVDPGPIMEVRGNSADGLYIDFGQAPIYTSLCYAFFTILNTGSANLTVDLSSSLPREMFAFQASIEIEPGGQQEVTIGFFSSEATSIGQIFFISNANNQDQLYFPYRLEYLEPTIEISGDLDFGNVVVGEAVQRDIKISNIGNETFYGGLESYNPAFSFTVPTDIMIAPSQSQNVTVVFSPTSSDSYVGNIRVFSLDNLYSHIRHEISCSGNGISIGPKISISGTMPEPTLNQAYAGYTFTAVGATGALTWSVSSGSLPPGMSFNATTATLSGSPTTAGNYTFTIKVASGGYSDEVEVGLGIATKLLYVKSDATGENNGTSWANAYTSLQSAISNAQNGDSVWVASGIYKPSSSSNRDVAFAVTKSVAFYGGFSGNESQLFQRNWNLNRTILSGDYLNNDAGPGSNQGDNAKRVFTISNTSDVVLDGFSITGGNCPSPGVSPDSGGGLDITNVGNLSVKNCNFYSNYAISYGGGIAIRGSSSNAVIENCVFTRNAGAWNGGGALFAEGDSNVTVSKSYFGDNSGSRGGAVQLNGAKNIRFENSVFYANRSGGGLGSDGGGAIWIFNGPGQKLEIVHCTFVNNTNSRGSGGALRLDAEYDSSGFLLANSIIIGSGSNPILFPQGISHTNVCDIALSGVDNINGVPTFQNASNPLGADGLFGTRDDGLIFQANANSLGTAKANAIYSVLEDASSLPRAGTPKGRLGAPDIGAYETAAGYAIINSLGGWLENLVLWNGNFETWSPPNGTFAVPAHLVDFEKLPVNPDATLLH